MNIYSKVVTDWLQYAKIFNYGFLDAAKMETYNAPLLTRVVLAVEEGFHNRGVVGWFGAGLAVGYMSEKVGFSAVSAHFGTGAAAIFDGIRRSEQYARMDYSRGHPHLFINMSAKRLGTVIAGQAGTLVGRLLASYL